MISEAYWVGKYTVEVYHNPSVGLSPRSQEKLIRECLAVAKNGFGEQHIDEESVRQHLLRTSTTIVIREEFNQAVGVAGSSVVKLDDDLVIYLQGATISKEHRGRGLYRLAVVSRAMAEVKKIDQNSVKRKNVLIGTRTQNPLVYKFMHRKLKMFPYPDGYVDERIKHIAKKLAKNIYDNYRDFQNTDQNTDGYVFDDNVFVAQKSLGFMSHGKESGLNLYGNFIPFCNDDYVINRYMQENMNWNNGDALIMLGYYNQQDVEALLPSHDPELHTSVFVGV